MRIEALLHCGQMLLDEGLLGLDGLRYQGLLLQHLLHQLLLYPLLLPEHL